MSPVASRPSRLSVWLLAIRPRTLPAAVAPVLVGTALAAHDGVSRALPAAAALVGALLIQVGTNLANDYFDFVRGADTHERVGPTRVTQAGLIAPASVRRAMLLVLALALAVGVYLVAVGGWPILVVGLLSLGCAVAYTGGPFPLAYHGLGDLFVFVFFGLVAVTGTYWVQALTLSPEALLAGAGTGALATALLVVNNLRDRETDARAGKRTLAVRIGRRGTQAEFVALLAAATAVPAAGMHLYRWPAATGAAWIGVLAAVPAARRVLAHGRPEELLPALPETARALLVWAVGLSLGLVW